ncbi:MAG TPA: dCMP deaminase family protein [Candidatus Thermoplasmatota archaeon]|nr:dCMP deaminase family protein [Candidatus Thermoplasmatota archaeon]
MQPGRIDPKALIAARPAWDTYFMEMARLAARRATCHRRQVGAVLVRDNRVLATGYNGNPAGFEHCAEIGCIREMLQVPSGQHHELCTGLHAEQNAIIQAAVTGVSIAESTLYTTTFPCVTCAKMILNARIVEVVFEEGYPDELGRWMLAQAPALKLRRFGEKGETTIAGRGEPLESVIASMPIVPDPRGKASRGAASSTP